MWAFTLCVLKVTSRIKQIQDYHVEKYIYIIINYDTKQYRFVICLNRNTVYITQNITYVLALRFSFLLHVFF